MPGTSMGKQPVPQAAVGRGRQRDGGTGGGGYSDGPTMTLGGGAGSQVPGLRWLSAQICHSSCAA